MSGPICYRCLQPVSALATRCPHCLVDLGLNGNPPGAGSSPALWFFSLAFVLALILGGQWGGWAFWVIILGSLFLIGRVGK